MPYADPEKRKAYHREYMRKEKWRTYHRQYMRKWTRARREKYMGGQECAWCGSIENLELHHINPEEKDDHRIWSWSEERIQAEMAKCIILCKSCHVDHHSRENMLEPEKQEVMEAEVVANLEMIV